MKIAIIGSKSFDSLEYHLYDSLQFMGHEIFHIDVQDVIKIPYKYNYWMTKLLPKYDEHVFTKIANRIIDEKPDLVIGVYRFIHPNCIRKIKKELKNVKVIHINPDALTTFEYQQIFVSDYDAYFTKDPYIVDFMKGKMNLNVHYLPEAFNQRVHKPIDKERRMLEEEINIDVVTFGTMYPYRANMVKNLVDNNIDVKLFGVPDRRFPQKAVENNFIKEYITGDRKSEVLQGAKIVFNNFHYAEIESVNVKFFEIGGIGAFQICDYKPIIKEYSMIDPEKFTYKNISEAVEKIKYYLDKPQERYAICEQQRKHFLEHHTYEKRMEKVIKIVNEIK
jgi:spore maturation protein CgeB